jgi:3-hydroxybutyryl-CoA dehydrogenase
MAHPMGPLKLADFIGLDTVLSIQTVMANETGDGKYRPSVLLGRMVDAGWLGRSEYSFSPSLELDGY